MKIPDIKAKYDTMVQALEATYGKGFVQKRDKLSKQGLFELVKSLACLKVPIKFQKILKGDGYVTLALILQVMNCYE